MEALTEKQKSFYEENGYLMLESRIPIPIIEEIRAEIARFTEEARGMTASNDRLDLEDSHRPDEPRVRRIKLPHTLSDPVARLMKSDHVLAPVRDLIGPDLRLHTTKLNMKSAGYGAAVEWHQDFAFYPHTNDDVLAVGVLIDDLAEENGPLMVFPGSHKGPIHDHFDDGVFVGAMDLARDGFDVKDAAVLTGPAGSISIHHGRAVHGSALNRSDRDRRMLFYEMMAADAFPIMGSDTKFASLDDYNERMLCGSPTDRPRLAPVPVRIPLPKPAKAGSIYELQSGLRARSFEKV
ncbi:phytanoyl-CoA dioxygenase family protein [Pikeienuella piscinae]|uniref:Phytanoyl-CoA dioxygenase family protein n=1 Tax=Pikeienuella piscinae TaxID=2748098 RepID=A0A7L5BWM4_9RHOB|nr:phytanoyl-CoA dioxygenase family protein [Pikeienuella piscinae]QIE56122.1 phytanoyl-CoA dioxygenase family protein [Pikeienuella piscinae]